MITLSTPALKKINSQLQKRGGIGIRVGVRTTGCSGLAYVLEYVDRLAEGDDSILFDVPVTEAKELLPQIKHVLEQGNFPTKVKCGNIYNKLNTISL